MIRRLFWPLWFIALLVCLTPVGAYWQSRDSNYNRSAPGSTAFQGAGDVVSGAKAWWGLRCYNATYTGSVADVFSPADASHTLLTCSTGGVINETIQALSVTCAVSCTVKTLFDQSGALNCGASVACDLSQTTIADRAAFTTNCIGSKPCLTWAISVASPYIRATGDDLVAIVQPLTISTTYNLTSSATTGSIISCRTGGVFLTSDTTPEFNNFAGSNIVATMSTATWYANQSVFSNASSVIYINGSSNSGTAGTNGCSTNDNLSIGWDQFNHTASAKTTEYGIWSIAFSGTQQSNMNSNQRSYWGF